MSSPPNEKFRRRSAKTDISHLFDDLPELDENDIVEEEPKKDANQDPEPPKGPKKVVTVDTAGSELFDDLPPIEIEDGIIKDLSAEPQQMSAFAKDGEGDVNLSEDSLVGLDPEDAKKKKLAQIMARRKNRRRTDTSDEDLED